AKHVRGRRGARGDRIERPGSERHDRAARGAVARQRRLGRAPPCVRAVRPRYASASRPAPAQAVAELLKAGARRVVLASYLLAPGLFAARIRDASLAAGA